MTRRTRWTAAAVVGLGLGTALVPALPAGATNPGPINLPALSVGVQESCTGAKIKHLEVTATLPGAPALAPTTTKTGSFVFQALTPGTYLLAVSAPGYEALSDGFEPGVQVTKDPGPIGVPAGTTITEGLVGVIQLVPVSPPPVCVNPGPPQVNALTGIVDDATTGKKVKHLSATITDPATGGEVNPGPTNKTGGFVQQVLAPGTWLLGLTAPGYTGFSGVQVTKNPGPNGLVGTITLGTELGILLPAVP